MVMYAKSHILHFHLFSFFFEEIVTCVLRTQFVISVQKCKCFAMKKRKSLRYYNVQTLGSYGVKQCRSKNVTFLSTYSTVWKKTKIHSYTFEKFS